MAQFKANIINSSNHPIKIDKTKCVGCNMCTLACQVDVLIPSDTKGQPPVVMYPSECWYCGCCVMECKYNAISLHHPIMNQTKFIKIKE